MTGEIATAHWLEPLYIADEMRALDAWAIEQRGVPSLDLMERAGGEVARAVIELNPAGPVRIVCGKGNNGGDGLVVARKLVEHGVDAQALLLWDVSEMSTDARANHERLLAVRGEAPQVEAGALERALGEAGLVVDALLGTGFSGAPRAPLDRAIEAINGTRCPVVAVDVPSGVDASSGELAGVGVEADLTVTFQTHKLGLWVRPGKAHAGRVEAVEIGIPVGDPGAPTARGAGLVKPSVIATLPPRTARSNKFSSGSVLVIGGSTGLTGAVCLSSQAAMRAGAGWVRAGVPASLNTIFELKLTEVMTVPLPDYEGALSPQAVAQVEEVAERADSVVLGPGLGRAPKAFETAASLIEELDRPLLVDADGLNALAREGLERAAKRSAPTVLTPHAGELARLLGAQSSEITARRLESARVAARRANAIVVLKGDDTLVVAADGAVAVNEGGSPALATAGTGDVLSGLIAAFMARGLDPFHAACAGVRAHSDAGRSAARQLGADSVIASDVVDHLAATLRTAYDRFSRPCGHADSQSSL